MTETQEIKKLTALQKKGIITATEFKKCKEKLETSQTPQTLGDSVRQMKDLYVSFWKKAFSWRGRATIEEFWAPIVVNQLVFSVLDLISGKGSILFALITIFPCLAVLSRRLHDLGKGISYVIIPFVTLILLGSGFAVSTFALGVFGFTFMLWGLQIVLGLGSIWALCALMNRTCFVTAKSGIK